MPRWIGYLGSWALFVLALGLAAMTVAGEVINIRDRRRLERLSVIDQMIAERTGNKADVLRTAAAAREKQVSRLQSKIQSAAQQATDVPDTGQKIIVSTAENKLWLKRDGQTLFEAVCSTGKGTTLAVDGKTLVFDTPIGKLHVVQKEENPQWVPPDWHYVEEARKNGMRVVHLNRGDTLDARSGQPARSNDGFWSFFRSRSGPVLKVKGDTVVISDGVNERELPPGTTITAGNAIVVPPVDTKQRHYDKVLGKFRLELGDGYGIHGTDEPDKLGQSVSHGCVRLGDDDIAKLYQMANVGDTVIIY
jgi:lipoprotein-anchoring transpeptidase ErfK/SrfK